MRARQGADERAPDEAVPDSTDVLAEQHGAELLEPRWCVVERPDDRLALGNGERQHLCHPAVGGFEPGAEVVVVDQAGEILVARDDLERARQLVTTDAS
jgi:hypothetical protein